MRRSAIHAIAGLFVLALSAGGSPAVAQQPSVGTLDALVGPFFAELATIRGLSSVGTPPSIVIRSRSETRRYVEQELNRKYPPAHVEAERRAMVAWGLIPADFDLRGFFLDLIAEQAAAYYDPVGKVMVLADWLTPEQQHAALLHELVHALQDREMSLDQFLAPAPGRGDQLLARQALIEGEAVALSLEVLLKAQGLELQQIPDLSSFHQLAAAQSAGAVFDRAPKFLREQLLFPYTQGLQFVHQFRGREPWSALGRLYRDPPRSTAQILHPATLLDQRQDPVPVGLPDLGPTLPPGWRRVDEDELGEWVLGGVLERHLGETAARSVATGWRGDRYQVWEAGRDQLLVYRVTWETEHKAETFAQAYVGVLESKRPALQGKAAKSAASTWAWQEGQQRFLVERRGLEVLVLEQVPGSAAQRVRQAVWSASPLTPAPTR
jgi:hypothetical protein